MPDNVVDADAVTRVFANKTQGLRQNGVRDGE